MEGSEQTHRLRPIDQLETSVEWSGVGECEEERQKR